LQNHSIQFGQETETIPIPKTPHFNRSILRPHTSVTIRSDRWSNEKGGGTHEASIVVSVSVTSAFVPPSIVVPESEQKSTVTVGEGLLLVDDFRHFIRLKTITTTKPTTNKTQLTADPTIAPIVVPEPLLLLASTRMLGTAL
jgi:hypothetical protein